MIAALVAVARDPLGLDAFASASRALLERRCLLRRVDTKFTLPVTRLPAILAALVEDYAVVRMPAALAPYRSLYFDTPELRCFHDHRRGRRIRHKIRIRHYPDRRVGFLEVKTRRSELVVEKHRIELPYGRDRLGAADRVFLREHVSDADALRPQIWIDYNRITLVGFASEERVTIDLDLEAAKLDGTRVSLGAVAVIEVKQADLSFATTVMRVLAAAGLREGSASKYVAGVAQLDPSVKKNRLLPALRAFERMS